MRVPLKPLSSYPFFLRPFLESAPQVRKGFAGGACLGESAEAVRRSGDAFWHDRPALFAH